jgi:SH3 domain protein
LVFKVIENKVINNRTQFFGCIVLSGLILFCALASGPVFAKNVQYVSDELKVAMRSGASNQHRIVKFIRSGTALTVLGTAEDGKFTQVELPDGKSGWILTEHLMDIPSGRERLAAAKKKFANADQVITELENKITKLKAEIRQLKKEKGVLQNERTNLSNSLDDLKITAANPLSLSKKNKQLKIDLEKAHANVAMLEKDNQQLRSNVMQEWFMIGGTVAIGSLILGIILTRINWRRKRNSWGDSF